MKIFYKQFGIYPGLCNLPLSFILAIIDVIMIFKQFRLTIIHFSTRFLCQLVSQHVSYLLQ